MSYTFDDLDRWFDDFVGVRRETVAKRWPSMTEEERANFRSRGFMRKRIHNGAVEFMARRKRAGLGTFDVENHAVSQHYKELHKRFLADVEDMVKKDEREKKERNQKRL